MYDDLLLKYITVAGISWRQSNCDSRDVGKTVRNRLFSRWRPKVLQNPWEVIDGSIDEVARDQLTFFFSELDVAEQRLQLVEYLSHCVETFRFSTFSREKIFAGKLDFFLVSRVHFRRQWKRTWTALPETSVYFDLITRRSEAHEPRENARRRRKFALFERRGEQRRSLEALAN